MFSVGNKMVIYFLQVYLHHPAQFPEAGTGVLMPEDQAKVFRVEVTPSVTESSPNVRALSISDRHCLFPDELRLSVFNTYTQQNCLLECRLKNIANYCGCYPYFFSAFTGKLLSD
jgi:amiloride-sensitive sodium channel